MSADIYADAWRRVQRASSRRLRRLLDKAQREAQTAREANTPRDTNKQPATPPAAGFGCMLGGLLMTTLLILIALSIVALFAMQAWLSRKTGGKR